MTLFTEWFSLFILNYPSFQYIIIFLGAAFGGELAIFALAFLAAQGVFSLQVLIILSFFGTFSSDILWFSLGKTAILGKIISHRYAHGTVSVLSQAIDRVSRGNRLIALILTKYLIGARVLLIIYMSKNNLKLNHFVPYNALAIIIWLFVVIPIGFISGLGFTYLAEVFHNLYIEIGLILSFLFVLVMIHLWLERIFIKKV